MYYKEQFGISAQVTHKPSLVIIHYVTVDIYVIDGRLTNSIYSNRDVMCLRMKTNIYEEKTRLRKIKVYFITSMTNSFYRIYTL